MRYLFSLALLAVLAAGASAQNCASGQCRPGWTFPQNGVLRAGDSLPGGSIGSTYYGPTIVLDPDRDNELWAQRDRQPVLRARGGPGLFRGLRGGRGGCGR